MLESLLVNRWFKIQYLFSQRNSLINAGRVPDQSTEAVSIITLEFCKEGFVFKGNWKSYLFCIPGQMAISKYNFEIRQTSVRSSLWLWHLFPTGIRATVVPLLASPTTCVAGLHTYPPLSSPILARPICWAIEGVREMIITLTKELANLLWVLAFFNHSLRGGSCFWIRRPPKVG